MILSVKATLTFDDTGRDIAASQFGCTIRSNVCAIENGLWAEKTSWANHFGHNEEIKSLRSYEIKVNILLSMFLIMLTMIHV